MPGVIALSDRASTKDDGVSSPQGNETTWPSAWTPASVRPAPTVCTSRRRTVASDVSRLSCTVIASGCRANPANSEPS